ncbi:Apoptosis-inducing factor 1 [Penicillium chermesinum]|uniref:Apoptosis-inducing factor 1 n=1 Tax=Penicillium chermesinum TaxID=63820 RepID=A0A9W9NS03_9EURO|nr:Apoptosis-inducing factor 1 [Penicillium chermesinum]KAJ5225075.1 Apoptosis-inducing factor 1 [Penicillium chermesinum]KAJ6151807.1 Apoptosis-inducing factor 1 [Penicillium chermesinum]
MAQQFKLKDIASLSDLKPGDKIESEVEGVSDGKVLLLNHDKKIHALSPRCTHYGGPLKGGVVSPDGRIMCPWHGACFNVATGDIENAPALNALKTFDVLEKDGAVYISGTEADIKAGQRSPGIKCSASKSDEKLVVVGGGSGTIGVVQGLREQKYTGQITIVTQEPDMIDRPKLSKALITDPSKIRLRSPDWFKEAGIESVFDKVTAVDFDSQSLTTASGKTLPYTKLVLAPGGIPRSLPLPGFKDLSNIFTLRSIANAQSIVSAVGEEKGKNIVVIGSSFIGMEIANSLADGNNVTVVGMEAAPLERVMGAQVGRIFQRNLESNGVKFKLEAGVSKATPSASNASAVGAVHLEDGTVLPADVVVVGVGVRPATDFLQGNAAIKLEKDGSVATDAHFAVPGLKGVFAVGDIATYPYHGPGGNGAPVRIEHWNVAQNAGRSVARAIGHLQHAGLESLKVRSFIPVFWSALGAQLRYCGNTVNGFDDVVLRGEPDNGKFVAYYAKGDVILAVATMGMDPYMVKSAELMRRGKMPSKKEIVDGVDVLGLDL